MYSRKQASVNIFFIGDIDHQSISSDPSYDKDHKKAKKITSKKYLDSILAKKEIKTKVKKWDKFVKDAEIIILK